VLWQIPDAVDTVVWAPDDGWKYHPKHVEQFPDINKVCNVASCWIYTYIGILLGAHYTLNIRRIRVKQLAVLTVLSSHIPYANDVYRCECPIKEDLPNWRWTYVLRHLGTKRYVTKYRLQFRSTVVRVAGIGWWKFFYRTQQKNPFINILKLRYVIWKTKNKTELW
jgi:hypothetical protein